MFWQREEKERQRGRETGATINSTLVTRGERKGHRETERMERDGEMKKKKPEWDAAYTKRIVHNPKVILLFITQTTEVKNNQTLHVQHSHEHNYNNKPQENHMYTGKFLALWTSNPSHLQAQKQKEKKKRNTSPSCVVNSYDSCCMLPIRKHTGRCSL